jgi:hypothetical protein
MQRPKSHRQPVGCLAPSLLLARRLRRSEWVGFAAGASAPSRKAEGSDRETHPVRCRKPPRPAFGCLIFASRNDLYELTLRGNVLADQTAEVNLEDASAHPTLPSKRQLSYSQLYDVICAAAHPNTINSIPTLLLPMSTSSCPGLNGTSESTDQFSTWPLQDPD